MLRQIQRLEEKTTPLLEEEVREGGREGEEVGAGEGGREGVGKVWTFFLFRT